MDVTDRHQRSLGSPPISRMQRNPLADSWGTTALNWCFSSANLVVGWSVGWWSGDRLSQAPEETTWTRTVTLQTLRLTCHPHDTPAGLTGVTARDWTSGNHSFTGSRTTTSSTCVYASPHGRPEAGNPGREAGSGEANAPTAPPR